MRKRNWRQWMAGTLALAMLVTGNPVVQASELQETAADSVQAEMDSVQGSSEFISVEYDGDPVICYRGLAMPTAEDSYCPIRFNIDESSAFFESWDSYQWNLRSPVTKCFNKDGVEIADFSELPVGDGAYMEATFVESEEFTVTIPVTIREMDKLTIGETAVMPGTQHMYQFRKYFALTVPESGLYMVKSENSWEVHADFINGEVADSSVFQLEKGVNILRMDNDGGDDQEFRIVKMPEVKTGENTIDSSEWIYSFIPEKTGNYIFDLPENSGLEYDLYSVEDYAYYAYNETQKWEHELKAGNLYYLYVRFSNAGEMTSTKMTITKEPAVVSMKILGTEGMDKIPEVDGYSFVHNAFRYELTLETGEKKIFRFKNSYDKAPFAISCVDAEGNKVSLYGQKSIGKYRYIYDFGDFTQEWNFEVVEPEELYPFDPTAEYDLLPGQSRWFCYQCDSDYWYNCENDNGVTIYANGLDTDYYGGDSVNYSYVHLRKGYSYKIQLIGQSDKETTFRHEELEQIEVGKPITITLAPSEERYFLLMPETMKYYTFTISESNLISLEEMMSFGASSGHGASNGNVMQETHRYTDSDGTLYRLRNGSQAAQSITMTVEKKPVVEKLEIVPDTAKTVLYTPFERSAADALSKLKMLRYGGDGKIDTLTYNTIRFNQEVSIKITDAAGKAVASTAQRLPAGKYTVELTSEDGSTSFDFEVKEITNELKDGVKINIAQDGGYTYAKLVVGEGVKISYEMSNCFYSVFQEDGSGVSDMWNLTPGTYYVRAISYQSNYESSMMVRKYSEPTSLEIALEGNKIDALFYKNYVYANYDKITLTVHTKTGETIESSAHYNSYFNYYPVALYVTDAKGKRYENNTALEIGQYTLHYDFVDFNVGATVDFEVKIPTDWPALQIGRKYTIPANYQYVYFTYTAAKEMNIYCDGDTYVSIDVYDAQTKTTGHYAKNQKIHLNAGTYYIRAYSYAGGTVHFETLQNLKSVTDITGKMAEITYGTWGGTVITTASGNQIMSADTMRVTPYAVINDMRVNTTASGNYYLFSSANVSGNNPYAATVSGIDQKYFNTDRPRLMYFDWILEAVEETGNKLQIKFNDLLWRAYGFAARLFFNEDGTPAQADRNGYLAPGTYNVQISDGTISTTVKVKVVLPKESMYIKEQPVDAFVKEGESAVFKVSVLGDGLTYQWQKSTDGKTWSNMASTTAKTAAVTVASKASMNGLKIRCLVKDKYGNMLYSNDVVFHVSFDFYAVSQPKNVTVTAGETAEFTFKAEGNGLTYQWQKSSDGGETWVNSASTGAKTNTLSMATKTSFNGLKFRCKVTTGDKIYFSNVVTLTVKTAPVIVTQPTAKTVAAGENVTFKMAATGDALKYQWQKSSDGGKTWVNSASTGATTNTLTMATKMSFNGLQFRCKVISGTAVLYTNAVTLTVKEAVAITTQPASQTITAGENVTFKIAATGDALKYQWQKSSDGGKTWVNSSSTGATTNTLTMATKMSFNGLQFRCKVTSGTTVLYTNAATLTVKAAVAITTQPTAQTVNAGREATFHVSATGINLTYQWQKSTDGGKTWVNSSSTGAKSATLTMATKASFNGLQFRCKLTSGDTVLYTNAVTLTVVNGTAVVVQPVSQTVKAGESVIFTANANGQIDSYQWQKSTDGGKTWVNSSSTGAKTDTLIMVTKASFNGLQFRCKITDSVGTVVYTNSATLTVK